VLVIHENRGLNPYVKDVARRLAVAGYMALAPDGLTSVGGYTGDDENGAKLFSQVDRDKMREDLAAAAVYLKGRADCTGKIGAIGFCFGGGIVNYLAVRMGADLAAGVPFYGAQPTAEDAAKIKAPINAQYGELDTRITGGWPAFDAALTKAGVPHEGHIYPGDDEKGAAAFRTVNGPKMFEDFVASAGWLKAHPNSTGKFGAVGFCFGGGIVNQLAVRLPDLGAGVAFYGRQVAAEDVPKIQAPLLLNYAGNDAGTNAGFPAFEAALKANNKTYLAYTYEGAQHGFHNDTTPRYDEAAAKEAWTHTLAWFDKYLKA